MFVRILKDAHDAGIIDLRRRGDDFEVARAADAAPVSEQLARTEQAAVAASAPPAASAAPAPRVGMGHRGARPRGRLGAPPPDLLSIGVVEHAALPVAHPVVEASPPSDNGATPAEHKAPSRGRRGRGKSAAKTTPKEPTKAVAHVAASAVPAAAAAKPGAKAKRGRPAAKKAGGGGARGKKAAPTQS
jgi:hypothetical protein